MKKFLLAHIAIVPLLLLGCASPQLPVSLNKSSFDEPTTKVAVVMNRLPKVDTQFPGAGCLLCLGVASMANSSLTTHTQTLPHESLLTLKKQIAETLVKKGVVAQVIDEDFNESELPSFKGSGPNLASKDFSKFSSTVKVDKVLFINIASVGIHRDYASYVPTAAPKAVVNGVIVLVNLKTNAYEWFMPLNVYKFAEGDWDEAPGFPGLTNAYFQTLEMAADAIKSPIKQLN